MAIAFLLAVVRGAIQILAIEYYWASFAETLIEESVTGVFAGLGVWAVLTTKRVSPRLFVVAGGMLVWTVAVFLVNARTDHYFTLAPMYILVIDLLTTLWTVRLAGYRLRRVW